MNGLKTMENESEKKTDQTAAPNSQASSTVPKRVVVNNGFDKLFFIASISFIAVSLFVVALFVFIALLPERKFDSVPDFVKYVTGDQYDLIVHKLGPIDDNLFRSSTAYLLVRTDADVISLIEQMEAQEYKFIPLDSPELETDKKYHQVYDSTEIDKVYRELAGTPPGADCRYFVTRDDPDYSTTYLCFSPGSKLLLVFRTMKRWGIE